MLHICFGRIIAIKIKIQYYLPKITKIQIRGVLFICVLYLFSRAAGNGIDLQKEKSKGTTGKPTIT